MLLRPVFVVAVLDGRDDRRSGPEQTMTPRLSLSNPGIRILFFSHLSLISLRPKFLPRNLYDITSFTCRTCEGRSPPLYLSRHLGRKYYIHLVADSSQSMLRTLV